MKKFLILSGIASIVCATEVVPAGAVKCKGDRYRFEPYAPKVIEEKAYATVTPMSPTALSGAGAIPDGPPTTMHVAMPAPGETLFNRLQEAPDAVQMPPVSAEFLGNHPLFLTLVQGIDPGRILINEIEDLSVFRLTSEMAKVPNVLYNYTTYILPKLQYFVTQHILNTLIQNKQIQIYQVLADFYILADNKVNAIFMMTRIANIYGLQQKNVEAFQQLVNVMEYIQNNTSAEDEQVQYKLGQIFLKMTKHYYYMDQETQAQYKTRFAEYKDLYAQYSVNRKFRSRHKKWLSEFM